MRSRWHRHKDAWLMGVLNCTPDSFSDGGNFIDVEAATRHGLRMRDEGAAIIDVGGESTRPGACAVPVQEELDRVIPVIRSLSAAGCLISLDTMKAEVMQQGIAAGASLINDVSALTYDPESMNVVAAAGVDVCLMHMQGSPASMQVSPQYRNVVDEVCAYFDARLNACLQAGIREASILIDPGIGFGKRLEDNLALIRNIPILKQRFGLPLLLGVSRKSFLGAITGSDVSDREIETSVAGGMGIAYGADVLRVHNVALQMRAIQVASAIAGEPSCMPE
ncbi:dihydropteroate synthase [Mariprofundus erugo]|uniref:Dihydropteroate synthase n=1 Tax=Mariprofundus erugo TaxID=2528639 RepID=A0A5R9GXK6_9PROT|nr:dihydropteroate synthase [Mariprofundus erugo]TLS68697.1 dihydropteroate synthase [Mariprofundus erugo]